MDIIDAAIASVAATPTVPAGAVMTYAGTSAPAGWLLCFGQAVSRTTYAPLFAVIGSLYGAGDGSTTFNLPDLRGRVAAGKDDMGGTSANRLTGLSGGVNGDVLGAAGGAESHTLTISQIPSHDHPYTASGDIGGTQVGYDTFNNPVFYNRAKTTSATGGGDAHNNVQPTIVFNAIIKT